MPKQVQTTCPYCGVGCGVIANVDDKGNVTVKGDPEHPANFGRLCSKGAALGDTLDMEGRLLHPEIEGVVAGWEHALDYTANKFKQILQQHGPEAIAFYVSGQLLTEDYYIANKLMKGFIGSANIDTNSRLCMSSAVAAHKRAFGSDSVPCAYEDLEKAELVILTGSNTAWCHPVLFQRLLNAKEENPDLKIAVIDPRHTVTCDIADLHLPIKPGMDHLLFNGLLTYLDEHNERNQIFVANFTEGLEAALAAARHEAETVEMAARRCGLEVAAVTRFYQLFARSQRVVTVFSQGINQWSYGTDKANAIINCHLLTGRIGRPGMGPFSFTGQPNAMGGREVGGLANQLAAHMAIDNTHDRDRVRRFWNAPNIVTKEGLKAVELFDAVEKGGIKALWIMATNPAVSLPDNQQVRKALAACEFVVVSDCMRNTDTTQFAHVCLPAQTWGERSGTVTNSERRISRQRSFLAAPGEARPDWWIVTQVAQRLGFKDAFDYRCPADVFREHATLSGFENHGQRDFDVSALAALSDEDYENFSPLQWPVTDMCRQGTVRLFGGGRFYSATRKAKFIAVGEHAPANAVDAEFPLVLNSGRIRDQWHTMTRTGKSAQLSGHIYEPFAELHPGDAQIYGIDSNALVEIKSRWGRINVRARISSEQRPGSVFVPIHWNEQFASNALVDALVNPVNDPISGQPEFKHTPVKIRPYQAKWYGFLLTRRRLKAINIAYWACSKGKNLWRYEIAGEDAPDNWAGRARGMLCQEAEKVEWVEYFDMAQNRYRGARIENGMLESCIFIGPTPELPERDWLANLFDEAELGEDDRKDILSGRSARGRHDAGRTVCACFGVGLNTLVDGIQQQNLTTAEAVGAVFKAGTNCGSCLPEIKKIISQTLGQVVRMEQT